MIPLFLAAPLVASLWFQASTGVEFLGDDSESDYWEVTDAMKNNSDRPSEEWKKLPEGTYLRTLRNERGEVVRQEILQRDSWTVLHRNAAELKSPDEKEGE